jgi:hypothetical protein
MMASDSIMSAVAAWDRFRAAWNESRPDMLHDFRRALSARRWDLIIVWRAIRGCELAFGNVPLDVVRRWARKDVAGFTGYPEIQDAVGYAQSELWARRVGHAC